MRKILFLFVILGVSNVEAQQDAQFTQYMYNTVNVNPAYAGSRGVLSIFGTHRAQWVGLEGAPTTSAASIHSPINNSKVGLGFSVIQDEIGPSDRSTVSADFSYTLNTSENYKLSFGLKGTASLFNVDYTKLNRYDLNDPRFQNNIDNQFSPNVGVGVYYHSDKLYAGISVPFILETKYFNDKFVVGGAYRWSAALSGLAGFQVDENWFIGYTYDTDTTKLANYNSGSHEIFLRYEFKGKQEKVVSPRFF